MDLFHHRWSVPILAELNRLTPTVGGARFAMLLQRLGVSRDTLSYTLTDLIERHGFVVRHVGYGHPLRPEYVLAEAGRPWAAWASRFVCVVSETAKAEAAEVLHRKWSAPVLLALAAHAEGRRAGVRFGDLKRALADVTPRALTQALRELEAQGWIDREVDAVLWPPTVRYRLARPALPIARVLLDSPG